MQFLFVTRGGSIRNIDIFMVSSCRYEIINENPAYALKAFICIFRNGPTSQCIMNTPLDDGVLQSNVTFLFTVDQACLSGLYLSPSCREKIDKIWRTYIEISLM